MEWPTCHPKSWRSGNYMWFACLRTLEGKLILVWPMEGWFSANSLSEMRLISLAFHHYCSLIYVCARNKDDIQSNQQRYDTAGEEVMLRSRTQVTLKHQGCGTASNISSNRKWQHLSVINMIKSIDLTRFQMLLCPKTKCLLRWLS